MLLRALLLALVATTSSCGTLIYNHAWNAYEPVAANDPVEGRWKGEWRSEENGHAGGLRCMLTREREGAYLARFHSTYGWFFFFRHRAEFVITGEEDGVLRFVGEEDLGSMFGGVYTYEGSVAGDAFEARFAAESGDHGVFTMTRVKEGDTESHTTRNLSGDKCRTNVGRTTDRRMVEARASLPAPRGRSRTPPSRGPIHPRSSDDAVRSALLQSTWWCRKSDRSARRVDSRDRARDLAR